MTFRGVVLGAASVVALVAPLYAGGGWLDDRGAAEAAAAAGPGPVERPAIRPGQASPAVEAANGCDVSRGQSSETIVVGRLLLGADEAERGAVLVAGGRIAAIGEPGAVQSSAPEATVIDCGSAYVSPGLVNAHEHPNVSGGFPDPRMRPSYSHREQWQGRAGEEHYPIEYTRTEDPVLQFWIELRHLLAGTTTLGGSGAVAGLLKNASWPNDPAYVYRADMQTFPYGTASATFSGLTCPHPGPAPVVDPASSPDFPPDAPYTPHIAEGTNCTAALEGQFYLDYVAKNPGRRYALIHGVGLSPSSIERLGSLDVPSSGRPGRIWPCTTRRWTCRTPCWRAPASRSARTGHTRGRTTSSRSFVAPRASIEPCGATACRNVISGEWRPGMRPTPWVSSG